MYTSIMLVALTGYAAPESLTWLDYKQAYNQAKVAKKPVAVFIGSGPSGYEKLCTEGKFSNETKDVLASRFLCVYVDASQEAGKRMAAEFGVPEGTGLVI